MALSTYTWVFGDILDNRAQFDRDPETCIQEMAESLCPIYTADIIAEWTELPSDKSDAWQEIGASENATITERMSTDLYLYYLDLVTRAWNEVENTHECDTETPKTISVSRGFAVATCSDCNFKVHYWECACELVHDCSEDGEDS